MVSTVLLGIIGAIIAVITALIQDRKLYIDLFEKRFNAYREFNISCDARLQEILMMDPPSVPKIDELRRIWNARMQLDCLFSSTVSEKAAQIERELATLTNNHLDGRFAMLAGQSMAEDYKQAYEARIGSEKRFRALQSDFAKLAAPYMKQRTVFEMLTGK
ncbi:conserved hypothetical protein [Hyphomicrobiales bacterium]|nr:conserved hypothetical protein [Hyphomicrobiales bacterium]CAH1667566.1 conserved hypothetical protein [Hyphomicrobiales bacterium]